MLPLWINWNPLQAFLPPEDPGTLLYEGSGSLTASDESSVVQLQAALSTNFDMMREVLAECGLVIARRENIVWDQDPHDLPTGYHYFPQAFAYEWAPANWRNSQEAKAWQRAMRLVQGKNAFTAFAYQQGFAERVPTTVIIAGRGHSEEDLQGWVYPVWVKPTLEQMGHTLVRQCFSRDGLRAVLEEMQGDLQIQSHIAGEDQSVHFMAWGDTDVQRLGVVGQLVTDGQHYGNFAPVPEAASVPALVDPVADAMARIGIRGYFAFDVKGGASILEANVRATGATPGVLTARRLGHDAFLFRAGASRLSLREGVKRLRRAGLLYDQASRVGVVPVFWGYWDYNGQFALVCLGSNPEEVYTEAISVLS